MPTRAPNATLQMVSRVANWTSLLASKACPRASLALWRHLLATVTEAPIRYIYILSIISCHLHAYEIKGGTMNQRRGHPVQKRRRHELPHQESIVAPLIMCGHTDLILGKNRSEHFLHEPGSIKLSASLGHDIVGSITKACELACHFSCKEGIAAALLLTRGSRPESPMAWRMVA